MQRISIAMLCLLTSVILARGQDTDADAVIKRAIDAAGGSEVLKKYPAGRIIASGTIFPDEKTRIPVTAEQAHMVPGRSRTTMKLEAMGQKLEVVHTVNAAKATYTINGSPVPITDAARQELIAAMTTLEIGQLLPLLTDKKFLLKIDRMAKDPERITIIVTTKPAGEFHLGFDRGTGHLTRLARKAFDAATGKTVEQEQVFSDFKLFDKLVRPTKVTVLQDGRKTLELTTEKYTPLTTVEAKEFVTE